MIPVPDLCRLEYLTRKGWAVGHSAVNLLHPEAYVLRLEARDKIGRCTVLDPDTLQPTTTVYLPACVPDPDNIPQEILERLVPTDTQVPRLRPEECEFCLGTMCEGDGSCLI